MPYTKHTTSQQPQQTSPDLAIVETVQSSHSEKSDCTQDVRDKKSVFMLIVFKIHLVFNPLDLLLLSEMSFPYWL